MKHHPHQRRPSIAVTPDTNTPSPEYPHLRYELKAAYADAVLRAGGLPFIVPYTEDRAVIEQYLDRVSGVVITGGAFDITPEMYGEAPSEKLGALKQGRTDFELQLLKAALQRRMPVLGICGGMQLLNVCYGGSLVQDIGTELQGARPHEQQHDRTQPQHPVDVKDATHLADALGGKGQLLVNSTHHQAVKRVADELVVSALAPDGVIEAIEFKDKSHFVVGVQWHPELLVDTVPANLAIYRALVHRARDRRH